MRHGLKTVRLRPSDDEDVQRESEYLRRRAGEENFPVALRVLPTDTRRHLRTVYDVARVIDDLGDAAPGDAARSVAHHARGPEQARSVAHHARGPERTAALVAFRADLATIWQGGTPSAPVLRPLAQSVAELGLPEQPFTDLIEANLRDQIVVEYATYEELLEYCTLSANPVGRLVLLIFGASTPPRVELSDRVCTALQIIEHCQDVAEDHRAGRRYLPLEDLQRFGVASAELGADQATPAMRALVRFEAERAEALLYDGAALLGELHGWARLAVAGYAAGGLAAIRALRRGGWSVLPTHPHRRRRDVLAALVALWLRPTGRGTWPRGRQAVRLPGVPR